jgi:hypothetical protein
MRAIQTEHVVRGGEKCMRNVGKPEWSRSVEYRGVDAGG